LNHWGSDEEFEELRHLINKQVGFNCNYFKEKCFKRRVATRLRANKITSYKQYHSLLQENPDERIYLEEALTVNVSKFFRNYEAFEVIRDKVLVELIKKAKKRTPPSLSIWSAGAATGEEPYSIAILFDILLKGRKSIDIKIIATDVSEQSLQKARLGIYSEERLSEMPVDIRERYFSPRHPYLLSEDIRKMVFFKRFNFFADRYIKRQDLILCRNVIIYFTTEFQDMLFEKFYQSLVPGGFLVLGKVETLMGKSRKLFKPVDLKERIFQKVDGYLAGKMADGLAFSKKD